MNAKESSATEIAERVCSKCKVMKRAADMGKSKVGPGGLGSWCKACISSYNKSRYAALTEEERSARISKGVRHRQESGYFLRVRYGISPEEYQILLAKQDGVCAICGGPPKGKRRFSVDHDHKCCPGEITCGRCIRGLLCITCNVQLGTYENAEWTVRADNYLAQPPASKDVDPGLGEGAD